jgi:hypothetical protein
MEIDKVVMLFFASGIILIFILNIWGDWAEKTYLRWKDSSYTWLGMDLFGISKNRENCVSFLKTISWFGMVFVLVITIAVLVLMK